MIRVLQVVTIMDRGGLETMIMNFYRNIDRNKLQFDFIVHREKRGQYDDEIEQLGGTIYRLPLLNPFSPAYHSALSSFFDKHPEYQVIHVHQDCLSSIILKEAWKHDVPVRIAHSHTSSQDKNLKYIIKLWYKQFIPRYATHLLACGKEAGDWMFNGAAYQVLNNAIDGSRYRFDNAVRIEMRKVLGVSDDAVLVGHVGRFDNNKNQRFLIELLSSCQNTDEIILLLVGNDKDQYGKSLHELADAFENRDKVRFLGVRSDVDRLMQAMDVFAFPSIYEGLPVTLIEAQAAGLPCVVSDSIPPECKKTDLVRFVSLKESSQTWIDAILEAAKTERRDTYEEIRKCGYDVKENTRWLENFYADALDKSRKDKR